MSKDKKVEDEKSDKKQTTTPWQDMSKFLKKDFKSQRPNMRNFNQGPQRFASKTRPGAK